jgi:hypothetical protein
VKGAGAFLGLLAFLLTVGLHGYAQIKEASQACSAKEILENKCPGQKIVPRQKKVPAKGEKAGGWESSGGDGVACWNNPEEAQKARNDLAETGFLSAESRASINTVVTLDSWDFLFQEKKALPRINFPTDFGKATAFETEDKLKDSGPFTSVEDQVSHMISFYTPIFSQRLGMLKERFPVEKWVPSPNVPQIDDSHPKRFIDPKGNCVLIQLAARKTKSQEGVIPETRVYYDKELFDKYLSSLEKSLLVFHEYLYLIGKEAGLNNSDPVRKVNAYLHSKQFFELTDLWLQKSQSLAGRVRLVRSILGFSFGNYIKYFKREKTLNITAPVNSPLFLHQKTVSMMDKVESIMQGCLIDHRFHAVEDSNEQQKIFWNCQQQTIEDSQVLRNDLYPVEAFMLVARFYFDELMPFSSESLLIWDESDVRFISEDQIRLLQFYCENLKKEPATKFLDIQDKARIYCQENLGI